MSTVGEKATHRRLRRRRSPGEARDEALVSARKLLLCAFADAVIGPQLPKMLGRDQDSVRRVAVHLMPAFF